MRRKTGLLDTTFLVRILLIVIFMTVFTGVSYGAPSIITKNIPVTYREIQIFVDGKKILGEEPMILNEKGIVMVPVRTIAQAAGKSVVWDGKKNIIYIGTAPFTAKTGGQTRVSLPKQGQIIPVTYRGIRIFAGGKFIGGEEPFILNKSQTVMVPLRTVVETIGKSLVWDAKKNTVTITSHPAGWTKPAPVQYVNIENMMVIRNVGPFFRQTGKPFTIAAGTHQKGLGVRLGTGKKEAEIVLRTNGKYKAMEGWIGVDDETRNTDGAFYITIFTDDKAVPSILQYQGGLNKVTGLSSLFTVINPTENDEDNENEDDEDKKNMNETKYPLNSSLYEKPPIYVSGPIFPASYPKYISPAITNISGALTVTIRISWVSSGAPGDYPDLTAVLADFKFIKP